MKVRVVNADRKSEAVAVPVTAEQAAKGVEVASKRYLAAQGFKGEKGQSLMVPDDEGRAVVLVGLGKAAGVDASVLRSAAAVAARAAQRSRTLVLDLAAAAAPAAAADEAALLRALAEGAVLGSYRYSAWRTKPSDARLADVAIVDPSGRAGAPVKAAVAAGVRAADAACLARDLVNEPGGTLTAPVFADRAAEVSDANGVACTVHDLDAVRALGFGGLLAVNQGSAQPARFVELAYTPDGAEDGDDLPTVALVGKGITFDSGGLSIKTNEGMATMKCDMAGAAAVLGAVSACRDLGVPIRVRGYLPMTDNMIGGDAVRVGDVIRHYGGSTTEVLNTDAEGRLVLADALAYATEAREGHRRPDAVLDIATLTGACMVALGTRTAGVMGTDDPLIERVLDAAALAGESMWPLPLPESERKNIESKIADRKNLGSSRYGGALQAGWFLRDFVGGGVPWAHLDIAGPAFNEGSEECEIPPGGTGFGVRTLLELLEAFERADI